MPLPSVIEIEPLPPGTRAQIVVPGSKSITNRALIWSALSPLTLTLEGALWSEDTQVMVDCLRTLGFAIRIKPDPLEESNRSITIEGRHGTVPPGGTPEHPLELFVGNAGTAARFLAALVCLGRGVYRLSGVPRMHDRPQGALFAALRQLGYRIDATGDRLPALIHGGGPRPGTCEVSIRESSQFASALLLASHAGRWTVNVRDENADESPYVVMTHRLMEAMEQAGSRFQVEPDCSSGSYFWGAGGLDDTAPAAEAPGPEDLPITVAHWPVSGWQVDQHFPRWVHAMFQPAAASGLETMIISRQHHLGDSIMTAIALAALSGRVLHFEDLGRLRVQECERVAALRTELTKCGARVEERGDTLTVHPSALHGAEIDTYSDHRMAMCFAILGLKVHGIRLHNPACVKKTFPNFFQKLAAAAPIGLGVGIRDASGRRLSPVELFAD